MIKILIRFFSTKLYDLAVTLAAFLSSKILKNIDKVSVLGILIMILKHFTKSKSFQYILILLKIVYAILSTYTIILYYTPYYSHIEILDYSANYIINSISYYKNNLTEAYDVLMHGNNKPEVITNTDEINDPFNNYTDKKDYNLGQESVKTSWFNNVYFQTFIGITIGVATTYVVYYYGHDIYDYIISRLTNRDHDRGSNPDTGTGSTLDSTPSSSTLPSSSNQSNIPSRLLKGKARELPNYQLGAGFISGFVEKVREPINYNKFGRFFPFPQDRLSRAYDSEDIIPYSVDSPIESPPMTPPLTLTPRPSATQLDYTPKVSNSELPDNLVNNETFNPSFDD